MRSNKKASLIIVIMLVVLISIAGASYAWFQANLGDGIKSGGNAASIGLAVDEDMAPEQIVFTEVLPGEDISLGGTWVYYTGTRHGMLRIKLGEIIGSVTLPDELEVPGEPGWTDPEIEAWFAGSYEKDGTVYYYTQKRLNEILTLKVDPTLDPLKFWHFGTRTKSWYRWVELDPDRAGVPKSYPGYDEGDLLSPFDIKFTGEFGGFHFHKDDAGNFITWESKSENKTYAPGERTTNRQWEQQSNFEGGINVTIEAIQTTKEAILDVWGQDALSDIEEMSQYPVFSVSDGWEYIGK